MANCYNVAGDSISCSDSNCIGADCSGNYEVGGTVINNPDFGLEGFAGMSQDEFQEWFMGLHDWGSTYEGDASPGVEDPQFIDEEAASQLSELFQGYNTLEELYLRGQNAENRIERQLQLEAWDEATNLMIEEQRSRDEAYADKQKEIFMLNESFDDYAASWANKASITEAVARKKELEGSSIRPGRLLKEEKELLDNTVKDILDDFYAKQDFKDEKMQRKLSMMDTLTANKYNKAILGKEQDKLEREVSLGMQLNKADIKLHDQILNLREDYELDILDTMTELGITGAFFEKPGDSEGVGSMECFQEDENGVCINWQIVDADGNPEVTEEGGGLCNFHCADNCTEQGPCGNLAEGWYWVGYNCCPGSEQPDTLCCPILSTGQCDQDGIPGCECC